MASPEPWEGVSGLIMRIIYPGNNTDIKSTTYEAKLADGSMLPPTILFDPINRKFTIRSNSNKEAGSFLVQVSATLNIPPYKPKNAPPAIIKIIIAKGNKYPPKYENEILLSFNVTSLKNTVIKLPGIKDRDQDPIRLIKYIQNVTSFMKVKGDN